MMIIRRIICYRIILIMFIMFMTMIKMIIFTKISPMMIIRRFISNRIITFITIIIKITISKSMIIKALWKAGVAVEKIVEKFVRLWNKMENLSYLCTQA